MSDRYLYHQQKLDSKSKELNENIRFEKSMDNMKFDLWNKFLAGYANNPGMKKKDMCKKIGISEAQINKIRKEKKLESPFRKKSHINKNEKIVEKSEIVVNKKKKYRGGEEVEITDEYVKNLIN